MMASAYGTWAQWRRRVRKADEILYAVDDPVLEHGWLAYLQKQFPSSRLGPYMDSAEVALHIAERRAG